jgi:hypothetical protein
MDQQHVVLNREARLILGLLAPAADGDCLGNAWWEGKGVGPEQILTIEFVPIALSPFFTGLQTVPLAYETPSKTDQLTRNWL